MAESLVVERFRIGYALAPRSLTSIIQDSLLVYAQQRGIDLIPIDPNKPLIEQGPFDSVFHKLYDSEWRKQLELFSLQNPTSIIVDPIDSIEKLHNRVSMLDVVNQLKIQNIGTPLQAFITNESETLHDIVTNQGLKYPLIAKPLLANATADSHKMFIVLKQDGLNEIKPPIVLQEFVNHGGVIFKVYVAGDHVKCVKRKSLTDITEEKMKSSESLIPFSFVSYFAEEGHEVLMESAEMPCLSFINEVANKLRDGLKLNLFNFDMIRDKRVIGINRYLIIDINYFPGYAKVPEYETILTPFFLDIAHQKRSGQRQTPSNAHKPHSNGLSV